MAEGTNNAGTKCRRCSKCASSLFANPMDALLNPPEVLQPNHPAVSMLLVLCPNGEVAPPDPKHMFRFRPKELAERPNPVSVFPPPNKRSCKRAPVNEREMNPAWEKLLEAIATISGGARLPLTHPNSNRALARKQ